jgi:hypothetical protein
MPEHDAGVETTGLAPVVEQVRADPDLDPAERETSIGWDGEADYADVYTEERGVMLSILRSPVARIHSLRVSDGDRFGATVPVDEYSAGDVTGVRATVPIGAVLIKSQARSTNRRGQVVSDHGGGQS